MDAPVRLRVITLESLVLIIVLLAFAAGILPRPFILDVSTDPLAYRARYDARPGRQKHTDAFTHQPTSPFALGLLAIGTSSQRPPKRTNIASPTATMYLLKDSLAARMALTTGC